MSDLDSNPTPEDENPREDVKDIQETRPGQRDLFLPSITRLLSLAIIRPHFALITLNPLLTLRPRHTTDRATLLSSALFLLPILLGNLDKPLVLVGLVLALVAPPRHPFASRLVIHQLLAALFVCQRSTRSGAELADALLTGEELPFSRGLGGWQGLVAWKSGVGGREAQKNAVLD